MPFAQKNIRQNAKHRFWGVLSPKYCQFTGSGFGSCTFTWQGKYMIATSSSDILPKGVKQILIHSFPVLLRIWLKIPFVLSALTRENKKRAEPVMFRRFDLFFTGQICTFVPVQQIFRDGYSEQSVLDFIFQWFCPVFVPFGVCLTEQNLIKYWFTIH